MIRQPTRNRQHDGVRNQVRRDYPRAFFIGRREIASNVGDGDVDDGGVEDFHEGRQHHRDRDDPRVHIALWMGIHRKLSLSAEEIRIPNFSVWRNERGHAVTRVTGRSDGFEPF